MAFSKDLSSPLITGEKFPTSFSAGGWLGAEWLKLGKAACIDLLPFIVVVIPFVSFYFVGKFRVGKFPLGTRCLSCPMAVNRFFVSNHWAGFKSQFDFPQRSFSHQKFNRATFDFSFGCGHCQISSSFFHDFELAFAIFFDLLPAVCVHAISCI